MSCNNKHRTDIYYPGAQRVWQRAGRQAARSRRTHDAQRVAEGGRSLGPVAQRQARAAQPHVPGRRQAGWQRGQRLLRIRLRLQRLRAAILPGVRAGMHALGLTLGGSTAG